MELWCGNAWCCVAAKCCGNARRCCAARHGAVVRQCKALWRGNAFSSGTAMHGASAWQVMTLRRDMAWRCGTARHVAATHQCMTEPCDTCAQRLPSDICCNSNHQLNAMLTHEIIGAPCCCLCIQRHAKHCTYPKSSPPLRSTLSHRLSSASAQSYRRIINHCPKPSTYH